MSTTDAASAVVAGIAALIRSQDPTLTSSQVQEALVNGSVPRPPSATTAGYGAGTVDALRAVQAAALIAGARRPASAPATAPAAPGTARPAVTPPRTGILGRAKTVLRDAAMAAGLLIVLLLASLVGIRVRRRRERGTLPAPEPRTLLNAPSGPLATSAGDARHARETAGQRAAATHMAAPGATPWRTAPGAQGRRPYAQAPGQAAPIWSPNRPGRPAHRAPWPAGRRPAFCPYREHQPSRARRHRGVRAGPASRVHARQPGIPEAAPSRLAPSRPAGAPAAEPAEGRGSAAGAAGTGRVPGSAHTAPGWATRRSRAPRRSLGSACPAGRRGSRPLCRKADSRPTRCAGWRIRSPCSGRRAR